ncbi:MAG: DUF6263 family protein [Verrucomicrobia bacterium]|nr:DUF6263 family protein [Verrucomicrobiota bacterium]
MHLAFPLPLIAVVALAFSTFTSTVAAEDTTKLEPTWKIGHTYTCEHVQDVTISIGAGDQAIDNPVHVALTFEATVEADGKEGGKAIRFKATKVEMNMSMFGTTAEYDSEDESKQSAELAGMIAGIKDTDNLKVIFDRNDTFVKFDEGGGERALKGADPAASAGLAPMRFGKGEIRQLLSYCVREFPDHPVKKGDEWKEENNVNLNLGSADMKMEMTAEGNDKDGRPVVTYTSDFEVDFSDGGPTAGGKGDGKLTGKMTYDSKQAIISDHNTTIDMNLSMNGLLMPVKQESKTKVTKITATKAAAE